MHPKNSWVNANSMIDERHCALKVEHHFTFCAECLRLIRD
jgi:hypothetical protein